MNTFIKYLVTVLLVIIGFKLIMGIIGTALHAFIPLVVLAAIIFILFKMWSSNHLHKTSR